jgi:hypothetical protein
MVAQSLGWSLVAWLANGVQIWILADKLGAPAGRTFAIALGGYAFAWCVGFVAIFDPAGAGIREALLVYALAPVLPVVGLPLAVALVSRAVNTVSDLLVAGAAAASRRRLSSADKEADGGTVATAGTAGKDQPPVPAAEGIIPVTSGTDSTA